MSWYTESGRDCDIAISSRVRLARNFARFPFPSRMTEEQAKQVLDTVSSAMLSAAGGTEFRLDSLDDQAAVVALVEKHLISTELAKAKRPKAVILSKDDSVSVMVNEEDHLRIQVMGAGLCLKSAMDRAERIDRLLEDADTVAFDEKRGYLTSCPTNLGTGLRAGVMLHLPALNETGAIRSIVESAGKLGFAVRGMYGEGSKASGDMYQFSNQLTLGVTEAETITRLEQAIADVIAQERRARELLKAEQPMALSDRVWRAAGTLATARLMTYDETLNLLSSLRLGVSAGLLQGITNEEINRLIWETGPAAMMISLEDKGTAQARDKERARLLRAAVTPVLK